MVALLVALTVAVAIVVDSVRVVAYHQGAEADRHNVNIHHTAHHASH